MRRQLNKRYSVMVVYRCDENGVSSTGRSTIGTDKRRMSETHLQEIEQFIAEEYN
jgi:hypothetical protein